jgi:hypothetical protein
MNAFSLVSRNGHVSRMELSRARSWSQKMSEPTTRIDAIGDNLYRISTAMPPPIVPGGFL